MAKVKRIIVIIFYYQISIMFIPIIFKLSRDWNLLYIYICLEHRLVTQKIHTRFVLITDPNL